jgi:hypothetical protein
VTSHDFIDKTVERKGIHSTWTYQLIYCRKCGWVTKDESEPNRPAPAKCGGEPVKAGEKL